ncbi:hypothetical protein [Methyloversatilis discipulorum]|jgi:hypothetical protein|uniref:hypothetical protein n=1 Tax=Methyloversatilis discipulorum TaxID=1119528 RepID=UPI00035F852C|nr:hypothetical protein [Methyloversatilis discipulorum]
MTVATMAALLLGGGLFAWWQQRTQRQFRDERAAVFDHCAGMFDAVGVADSGAEYPRLSGRYGGAQFELQAMLDHVGYRKVPSLWLSVTLRTPLPVGGRFDLLMRPQNIEFWSASDGMDERIDLPADWPVHQIAKVSPAGWRPPLGALREAAGSLIDEPSFKELLVSPRGVRIVFRVGGVQRAHYLVLRSLLPDETRVEPELLQPLLDAALRIASSLKLTKLEKAA